MHQDVGSRNTSMRENFNIYLVMYWFIALFYV